MGLNELTKFLLSGAIFCGSHIPPSAPGHLPWAAQRWNKQRVETESEQYNSKMEAMLASQVFPLLPEVGTMGLKRKGGKRTEYSNYPHQRLQQGWKQAKANALLYSKPLLCANTANTAYKAKIKPCKMTEIHMMSSMGRSANPEEIPTM